MISVSDLLLYGGSVALIIWGAMHIFQGTSGVVAGFEPLSDDNRRILTMEWVGGGLTLCFTGLLIVLITLLGDPQSVTGMLAIRFTAAVLVVRAAWEAVTGARTPVIQFRICVWLQTGIAILYLLATWI